MMKHSALAPLRLSKRLHRLLQHAGLRVLVGPGPGARGGISRPESGPVRTPLRLPHPPSAPVAQTSARPVPLPGGPWMPDPPGEARAVPPLPVLARDCRERRRLACRGGTLSGYRKGTSDPDWNGARTGPPDARGLSLDVLKARQEARLLAENLANAETTRTSEGGP